jgi:hypothetical protein
LKEDQDVRSEKGVGGQARTGSKGGIVGSRHGRGVRVGRQALAVRVYFNASSVPGDRHRVYMEWTEDVIASTYRSDSVSSPPRAQELYAKLGKLTVDSWIEFYELMTPEKLTDLD